MKCPQCDQHITQGDAACVCGYLAPAATPATWVISHCVKCHQVAIRHQVEDPDRVCKWCAAGVTLATSWAK